MFRNLVAGAVLALSAIGLTVPAQAAGTETIESQIITGFPPFAPPMGEILFEDGTRTTLADYPGELVLATVWFTTCPNCQIEMPELSKLSKILKDQGINNIRVLPISIDEVVFREAPEDSMSRVRKYYDRKKLNHLPVALDLSARNAGLLFNPDPVGTPTTFFISPTGDVIAVLQGWKVDWTSDESIAYLRSLAGV
jgi:thiol-disulfide isomerase/thioredoxin